MTMNFRQDVLYRVYHIFHDSGAVYKFIIAFFYVKFTMYAYTYMHTCMHIYTHIYVYAYIINGISFILFLR